MSELKIQLNEQLSELLARATATGLYGNYQEHVAVSLIAKRLEELIVTGIIRRPEP